MEPNGNVKNCIISTEVIGNIKQQSIEEIIQANRKIRQDMLDGKYPSNCAGCYKQEKHRKKDFSSISSRLYYAKEITPKVPSELFEKAENFKLKHVDLRWTNKCNQACVYCGPEYSSKWEQELGKKMQFDKTANERLKDYIYEHVQDLENVYLAGGEPMLMKQNKDFLEHLYKHNPNATLRVNSNLSKTNTGIFDLICKFQNVHWTVSVESIEEEYNYIRHHGNWHDFLENLQTLKNTNHKITFNMLYFILNHRSIFDCVNFFQKQGFHNNSFVIGPLHTPLHLNVLNLPKKIINECVELFQKQIDSKPGFLLQNSYENILSYLTETEFYANIELTKQELLKMDQRRNIDSRKVFQKLYKEAF